MLCEAQAGLKGEYYAGTNFEKKIKTQVDSKFDFNWRNDESPAKGIDPEKFSVRWNGNLTAPETGTYTFFVKVDDGVRVWVGDQKLFDAWDMHDHVDFSATIYLKKDQTYPIKVEYFNGMLEGQFKLYWEKPSEKPIMGGYMGRNQKIISSSYFTQTTESKVVKETVKETVKEKVKVKEPVKEVKKDVVKNEVKKDTKPKPIEPKPIVIKDTIQKYTPRNILFQKSEAIMLSSSNIELDNLANMLRNFPKLTVSVEGHTDNVGDDALNQKLSEDRAKAVVAYLQKSGIAATRLSAKGFGHTRPLVQGSNERNRRVEFVIR